MLLVMSTQGVLEVSVNSNQSESSVALNKVRYFKSFTSLNSTFIMGTVSTFPYAEHGLLRSCYILQVQNYTIQNNTSLKLLEKTWLRIEQFLPDFMKQLFPSVVPPTSPPPPREPAPSQVTTSPEHTSQLLQSHLSTEHPVESVVVVQEVPVTMTMDHVTGGVTMAATPIPAPCSPSRSPDPSPHASPPTSSSPGESFSSIPSN